MITNPERKLDYFTFGKNDYVSFHYEATAHPLRVAEQIQKRGAKALVALNPATPLCVLDYMLPSIDGVLIMSVNPGYAGQSIIPSSFDKIRRLRNMLDETESYEKMLQVDGNVSFENAEKMIAGGANCLVCGSSSLFSPDTTLAKAYARLRSIQKE